MKKNIKNARRIVLLFSSILMLGSLAFAGCGKKDAKTEEKPKNEQLQKDSTISGSNGQSTTPANLGTSTTGSNELKEEEKGLNGVGTTTSESETKTKQEEKKDDNKKNQKEEKKGGSTVKGKTTPKKTEEKNKNKNEEDKKEEEKNKSKKDDKIVKNAEEIKKAVTENKEKKPQEAR